MKKTVFAFLGFCVVAVLVPPAAYANNLTIANVSLENRNQSTNTAVVEFDLSWENSWKDAENHDAAWVFFKVSVNSGAWKHGMMAAAGTDPAGTSDGSGTGLTINVPADKAGAFLYRTDNGTGDITNTNINLVLDYGASPTSAGDADVIEVQVYGMEMVYIPEGIFRVGKSYVMGISASFVDADCNTSAYNYGVLIGTATPYYISEKNDCTGTYMDIAWQTASGGGTTPTSRTALDSNFPEGYEAFYMMKYELTQGQYRDFLNTLSSAESTTRTVAKTNNVYAMTNTATPSYRQTIKYQTATSSFVCDYDDDDTGDESNDGEWIAMNYLCWPDCAAVADWAGLRPASEMEWEKGTDNGAIRGPACDSATVCDGPTFPIANEGEASELPADSDGRTCYHNFDMTWQTNPGIERPLRVGFAAEASTNRSQCCAGEFGAMDMSGNVEEMAVCIGTSAGLAFRGSHGDGILTTTSSYEGNATNTDWPGIDTTTARGVTGSLGMIYEGGNFHNSTGYVRMRTSLMSGGCTRTNALGCRLIRSAP